MEDGAADEYLATIVKSVELSDVLRDVSRLFTSPHLPRHASGTN